MWGDDSLASGSSPDSFCPRMVRGGLDALAFASMADRAFSTLRDGDRALSQKTPVAGYCQPLRQTRNPRNMKKVHSREMKSWAASAKTSPSYSSSSSGAEVTAIFLNVVNRSRKSRHDRVAAGSHQSIETQGNCLHLKDTKYQYKEH